MGEGYGGGGGNNVGTVTEAGSLLQFKMALD